MKKKLIVSILMLCLVFSYGCSSKENTSKEDLTQPTTNNVSNEQTKIDENEQKEEDNNKEKQNEEKEENFVSAMYFNNDSVVVFDKSISEEQLKKYISKNSKNEFKENTILKVIVKDKEIEGVESVENIKIEAKYIGLSDATSAEFSYNSKSFNLNITNQQMEKLEKVQDDQLLELDISKSENGNFILKSFEIK